MRTMKNKKIKATLSIVGYFLLVVALCFVAVFVFHSYYYESVYVSGASMYPTLNGNDNEKDGTIVDFGIVDGHKSAINHIKRFDIISTYYPDNYSGNVLKASATKKIKRVIALPGETFIIENGELSIKEGDNFAKKSYSFKVSAVTTAKDTIADGKIEPITLGEDEFWVLGDNRTNSTDCGSFNKPIKKEYISGVLVAIEGTAKLKVKNYRCNECGKVFDVRYKSCDRCGSWYFTAQYKLVDKNYSWPKFF